MTSLWSESPLGILDCHVVGRVESNGNSTTTGGYTYAYLSIPKCLRHVFLESEDAMNDYTTVRSSFSTSQSSLVEGVRLLSCA